MKAVIFDLDGTLADTAPDLVGAANAVAAAQGWPALPFALARRTAGRGGRALIALAMAQAGRSPDAAVVEGLVPGFLAAYGDRIADQTRLYPHAAACLDALGADGWRLGVCTNKPEALALRLLAALGVLDRFGAVLGADSLPVRKPDPAHLRETARRIGADPRRTALVGDTVTDRDTARAAGTPFILCRFGYGEADLEGDAAIDCLSETSAALVRLLDRAPTP